MAIEQYITIPNDPPSSTDRPNFRQRADAFVAWMKVFATQIASLIPQLNTVLASIESMYSSITNAYNAAIAAANFQGTWTNQTTQMGQSWEFEGIVYRVLIAGNTSPTSSPLNWTSIATTSDALMDEINLKADKATTYNKTEVDSLVGDGFTLAQAHATALSF